jgi:glycerol-3-phosphate dehydrogenase
MDLQSYTDLIFETYPWFFTMVARRYVHHYGTRVHQILQGAESMADLGQDFGHGLFEKEITYLRKCEWAHTADDILWRRTKLGLLFSAAERAELDEYLKKFH